MPTRPRPVLQKPTTDARLWNVELGSSRTFTISEARKWSDRARSPRPLVSVRTCSLTLIVSHRPVIIHAKAGTAIPPMTIHHRNQRTEGNRLTSRTIHSRKERAEGHNVNDRRATPG